MASKFKIKTEKDRIEQMYKDNPSYTMEFVTSAAREIRKDSYEKMLKMIPNRFLDAEITDALLPTIDIQDAVMDMLKPPPDGKTGIIFTGSAGCGKTHAAIATMKYIASLDPEMVSYFGFYPKIIQELRSEFSEGSISESGSTWDRICNESGLCPGVIIIDDVASAKPSDFELEKFFIMIDRRTNEYLPTILTTNVPPEKFEEVFGQRISSRLLGYFTIVNFPDHDFRDK